MKTLTYNHTIFASYIGYITQAIVNNFAPLLFLTFQRSFSISVEKITLLITFNFLTQLIVDMIAAKYVDRIGYRIPTVAAHILAAAGLVGLAVFPYLFSDPFVGLVLAIVPYAIGGGLIEVLVSPIVEACPTENKASVMSLLHSFYCWGQVGVVLLSTLFFTLAGIENWRVLACVWAVVPLFNAFYYAKVPILMLTEKGEAHSFRELFSNKLFWLFVVLMLCAGASELSMSQWASAFAESGLGVSKSAGDLAGPCTFAVLMGISRVFYAKFSEKIDLRKFMLGCGVLCVVSYLIASLSPVPVLSLIGCGLCGLSVGIMWPGTVSLASARIPRGGTAMFGLFALFGDFGCITGPTLVGMVSGTASGGLKAGLLTAIFFPAVLATCLLFGIKNRTK